MFYSQQKNNKEQTVRSKLGRHLNRFKSGKKVHHSPELAFFGQFNWLNAASNLAAPQLKIDIINYWYLKIPNVYSKIFYLWSWLRFRTIKLNLFFQFDKKIKLFLFITINDKLWKWHKYIPFANIRNFSSLHYYKIKNLRSLSLNGEKQKICFYFFKMLKI